MTIRKTEITIRCDICKIERVIEVNKLEDYNKSTDKIVKGLMYPNAYGTISAWYSPGGLIENKHFCPKCKLAAYNNEVKCFGRYA